MESNTLLTAQWISVPHSKDRVCSNCGHTEPYKFADRETEIFKFCPFCGARITQIN